MGAFATGAAFVQLEEDGLQLAALITRVGQRMKDATWPAISDETLIERLIPAIQHAIVTVSAGEQGKTVGEDLTSINAPDAANALLMILATLLEPSPACATPRGIRLLAEAAGKELAELIRDTRRLTASTVN